MPWLWVALGGALGSVARHGLIEWFTRRFGTEFPAGTLAVNVVGSFAAGVLAGWLLSDTRPESLPRLLLITGFCGGFTTFSAFSLQTLGLLQQGQTARAAANVGLSLLLCLVAVWAGHAAAVACRRAA